MNLSRPAVSEVGRFALFLVAGMINTLFGYGVFALLTALGFAETAAVVMATAAGVLFNFRTFGTVFAARGLARLPHFIAVYAVLTLLNIAILATARGAGLGPYLGEAAALCVVTPLTFLALRFIVFNTRGEASTRK
ncbi:MAG: GtrA family protein [Proteobacteria bacterium]|nr:GtrA family protein [Pseudomonadota bacterium]